MKKIDARTLSREALKQCRVAAVRLYREGMPVMMVVESTGLSWSAVNAAIKRYQAGGIAALVPAARGRKSGSGRKLSGEQEVALLQMIRTRRPMFYKLSDLLWSRDTVMRLIDEKFGVKLSIRGADNYLHRWGIARSPSKKLPRDRCSPKVRQWLDDNRAEFEQRAREGNADMYWLCKPAPLKVDMWLPVSNSAESSTTGKSRKKLAVVTVVNSQGMAKWAIVPGAFGSVRQIKFVEALLADSKKKALVLVRTDEKIYGSDDFRRWVRHSGNSIEVVPERIQ